MKRTYNGCLEYVSANGNQTVHKLNKHNMTENSVDWLDETAIKGKEIKYVRNLMVKCIP